MKEDNFLKKSNLSHNHRNNLVVSKSDLDEFNKAGAEFSSGMSQSEISVHKQEVRQI